MDTGLIFDWRRRAGSHRRLWIALASAAALHVLWFYLFKVGTPPAPQSIPPEETILLLDPADPEAAAVLRSSALRTPGLTARDPLEGFDLHELEKVVPEYRPTWENHVASLQPRPAPPVQPPGLHAPPNVIALPPFPGGPPPAPAPSADATVTGTGPPIPTVVVQSGAAGRRIAAPPAWPDAFPEESWPEHASVPFLIKIQPDGRIADALPLNPARGPVFETIRSALLRMRFDPATSESPDWSTVDVRW